ncbi:MAG: flavodoxin domain-containing protein [Eubacteriales bacterium]|nr:flavodoxin domain-containing protein [Eubacteriales bacterium]
MKTGIIFYSQTGHTRQAAQKLLEAMRNKGQNAELLEIKVSNAEPEKELNKLQFVNSPSVTACDKLVFASPVWAFSLAGVMKAYLAGLTSLSGKTVSLFVTHQLPLPWMGGNAAIRQMKKICEEKGAKITSHAVISWGEKRRERDLLEMVDRLT